MKVGACGAAWHDSVAAHTRLPYNKSTTVCYNGALRTSSTVVTTLLHQKSFPDSILARTLPNLLTHTAADVGFFHTGWNDDEIADLQATLPYITFVTCVATDDWAAPDFRPAEFVEKRFHNGGYRSMCRWYSSRVSACLLIFCRLVRLQRKQMLCSADV